MAFYNCPRISFSVDFIDSQQPTIVESSYKEAPAPYDFEFFEFSVPNDKKSMISADKLFFKGKMVPMKENRQKNTTTTIRDELLANDDNDGHEDTFVSKKRQVKGGARWRERLGLKRSNGRVVPKKGEINTGGGLERIDEVVLGNFKGLGLNI